VGVYSSVTREDLSVARFRAHFTVPIDASDMIIVLKDKSEWTSAKTFDELSEKMANELEAVPGVPMVFNTQYKCDLMS
jgi:Cu/Ag efflux pump CusA